MKDYIVCKPVMLPQTDVVKLPAICIGTPELGLRYTDSKFGYEGTVYYHLYLISDENIKTDDKVIQDNQVRTVIGSLPNEKGPLIVATTDKSLSLPLIPQSFIEEYVEKQGKIDKVRVDMSEIGKYEIGAFQEVIILPIEDKPYDFPHSFLEIYDMTPDQIKDKFGEDFYDKIRKDKKMYSREEVKKIAIDYIVGYNASTPPFDQWFDTNYPA